MLFCCLWRNVETFCHKHFVVVFRHQQTPPLTTSGNCHNLPRSGSAVLITPSRLQPWQHAVKPDIGSESRFLPTPPTFDAPVRGGVPVRMLPWRLVWKKLEWRGYLTVKKILKIYLFVLTECTNVTDRRTDTAPVSSKILLPLKVNKGHSNLHNWIWHKFLLVFHCNYGHILYRFWDKGLYWSKIAIFHTLFYITAPALGKTAGTIFVLFFAVEPYLWSVMRCE